MFRRAMLCAAMCALIAASLSAQNPNCTDRYGKPAYRQPCGRPCPECQCVHPPNDFPSEPESANRPESAPVNPGMFVAPPRSGTVSEEAGSVGIRGLALHFPEIRIGL